MVGFTVGTFHDAPTPVKVVPVSSKPAQFDDTASWAPTACPPMAWARTASLSGFNGSLWNPCRGSGLLWRRGAVGRAEGVAAGSAANTIVANRTSLVSLLTTQDYCS